MNEAVQSLGYGLAALLFCAVICAICQMIKKLAYWFLHHDKAQSHGGHKKQL